MKIYPPEPEIGEFDGFTEANDIFGYSEFGGRLANLVLNLDDPSVLLLDDDWGTGKSTFVKQWAGLLRQRGVPVIHFDAFANDFHENAFIALCAEVISVSKNLPEDEQSSFLEKSKSLAAQLLPLATKAAIQFGSGGALDDAKQAEATRAVKKAFSDAQGPLEDLLEVELTEVAKKGTAISEFQDILSGLGDRLVEAAQENNKEDSKGEGDEEENNQEENSDAKPSSLIFIIDELDRCRPEFAIEILEKIKHVFSATSVHFLLVANFDQLSSLVAGHERGDQNAKTYLEKFFHLRFHLPSPARRVPSVDAPDNVRRTIYIQNLWSRMGMNCDVPRYDEMVRKSVSDYGNAFDCSLRSLNRIASHVALLYAATNEQFMRVPSIAVGLCFMRLYDRELYFKAKNKSLTWEEANSFFRFDSWPGNTSAVDRYRGWWQSCIEGKAINDQWAERIGSALFEYGLSEEDIIPYLAKRIDEFAVIGE